MIDLLAASLLASAGASSWVACPAEKTDETQHLLEVCDPVVEGARAYSATFRASLNPPPAAQQVTIFERDGEWFMHVAGYRWKPGEAVVTRRNDMPISAEDALALVARLEEAGDRLAQLSYYGAPNVICTDGASFQLASAVGGQHRVFSQHSCAGKSELHAIAAAFRSLAIKYEPQIEGMLYALDD